MRMSSSGQENYPELFNLVKNLYESLGGSPVLASYEQHAGDLKDQAVRALSTLATNPWVAVQDVEADDRRGGFSLQNPNTIIVGRALAEKLGSAPDDEDVLRTVQATLLRGLLHWLSDKEWSRRENEPGFAFEDQAYGGVVPDPEPKPTEEPPGEEPELPEPPDLDDKALAKIMGSAILDIAVRHLGQKYAHTPTPDYHDPNWQGAFDCAEYASYCVYRAYGTLYGAKKSGNGFEAYTGYWRNDANKYGIKISTGDALNTPGAFVLRNPPGSNQMGHIGISLGNGKDIYEARGRNYGVVKSSALGGRTWHTGVLIPGVLYDAPDGIGGIPLVFKLLEPPLGHSPIVEIIQKKLASLGLLTEPQITGIYDKTTAEAVYEFQKDRGLEEDGEVGPKTGRELGLEEIWKTADIDPPGPSKGLEQEILTLARTLYGEARGEPRDGIEAVANVIMNRVRSPRYPNTVSKVCLQPWQFSCWNHNDPNRNKIRSLKKGSGGVFDSILDIASRAVRGLLDDKTSGAQHYHAKSIATPLWVLTSPKARIALRIARHIFYTGIR